MSLCHLSEAVAAPLSRGDSPKHGDSERIREQAPRRGYSAIQYFNRLLVDKTRSDIAEDQRVVILNGLVAGNSRIAATGRIKPVLSSIGDPG